MTVPLARLRGHCVCMTKSCVLDARPPYNVLRLQQVLSFVAAATRVQRRFRARPVQMRRVSEYNDIE